MTLVRKANNSKIVLVQISKLLKSTQLRFQQNTVFMWMFVLMQKVFLWLLFFRLNKDKSVWNISGKYKDDFFLPSVPELHPRTALW